MVVTVAMPRLQVVEVAVTTVNLSRLAYGLRDSQPNTEMAMRPRVRVTVSPPSMAMGNRGLGHPTESTRVYWSRKLNA
jgi:hypothetical protein